ncbi:plastocyanin/azurin family copper-binding protein [Thiomicrospira sp. R3]|uniref:cupredoxin domain-containing protein n=1 Tax=Thiomicrospira sp. R3 TaxID=3035472 RepID=UPI00259B3923|nr:plastocyanin/azurin family copper-binding protein [Thiomicrospira sp. R3]WFE69535.1 plastocyanin/azurin family copper-binding protein [Thiomicrospira sp. R3]
MKTLSRRQFILGASVGLVVTPLAAWAHNHGGGHDHRSSHTGQHDNHGSHGQRHADHHHGMDHTTRIGRAGQPKEVNRTIQIDMDDNMRFSPNKVEIKAGDTVRFFVRNRGQLQHVFVIGTRQELEEHAEMMKNHPHMAHDEPNMISLKPRQRGAVIWHFDQPGTYYFGCLEPGHFEAGMLGQLSVKP